MVLLNIFSDIFRQTNFKDEVAIIFKKKPKGRTLISNSLVETFFYVCTYLEFLTFDLG